MQSCLGPRGSTETLQRWDVWVQGKELKAGMVLRGMAPLWLRPAMAHALQAQTTSGALQGAQVWCARLWA